MSVNTDDDDYENYADLIYETWYDIQELDRLEKLAHATDTAPRGQRPRVSGAAVRVDAPPSKNKNHKRCMKCGVAKPIRHFAQPRHRLCMECRADSAMPAVDRAAARRATQPLGPLAPILPKPDPWLHHKDMAMEYARQRRADQDAWDRAQGKPVRTPRYASVKFCVRCKTKKPTAAFDHPRDRVCLACYNPNITTGVINT